MFVKVPGVKLPTEPAAPGVPPVAKPLPDAAGDGVNFTDPAPDRRKEKFFLGITDETRVDL